MASFGSTSPVYVPAPSIYDKWAAPSQTADPQQTQAQQQPALTAAQQMKQLEQEGKSVSQIADAMGVPTSEVQSELGITATSSTTTPLTSISIKA